ncbi:divalent-cation tolerance protein CutA [Marinicella sp. S1101]|uniref:divalent-cation tolerance protein CutA n=1 Tax=Marinicella marina TaxID=2996016 RepID=UPI002260D9FA|nr:divalent-cation tolerance protein CutA [Marinicella marina]MCX7552883.1 divalent-cation tolerance protein CutA [Marinicella marina]MDJ1139808.1 divalent-cation tolerance protein CutA [Marinicella marina]
MNQEAIQVFVSCESSQQAKKLVDSLLNDQIIACAQMLKGVESFYRWQGQITQSNEVLLVLKTTANHFKAIETSIKKLHSYDVPEILAIPVLEGSTDYLKWINEQV